MRTAARLLGAMCLAVWVSALAGCSADPSQGYTLASQYPEDVKTVAVPIWKRGSEVYRRDVEFRLSEAISKRLTAETPYRLASREQADTILEGTIRSVDQHVMSFNPDQGTPRNIQVRIVVDYTWTDLRTGAVRFKRTNFSGSGVYYAGVPIGEDFFQGSQEAFDDLAVSIIESLATWPSPS